MKRIALLSLITIGLGFVVGCGKDETPQTAEEASEVASEKLDEIRQYIQDQDMEKAEETLSELRKMAEDASGEAEEALQKAVDSAKSAIEAAKAGEEGGSILDRLGGDGD
ncbi:MAG: hypothetical protein ACOC9S_05665 [Planctomycetota bacterium]